jgi:hypothetical protein
MPNAGCSAVFTILTTLVGVSFLFPALWSNFHNISSNIYEEHERTNISDLMTFSNQI